MADLVLAYDIINDTTADAIPVQANYTRIEAYVNNNVIRTDGATVMAAPLQLFGDPVSPNDAVRKGFLDMVMPVGVILPYGGSAVPGGVWAIANGADLSTTVYPDLFAAFAYRFGGAGSTFKLPNFAGRVPVGQNTTDAAFDVIGEVGGSKDAALPTHVHDIGHGHTGNYSGNQNQDHNHVLTDGIAIIAAAPNHSHTVNDTPRLGGGISVQGGSDFPYTAYQSLGALSTDPGGAHDHLISGRTDGANQNHSHFHTPTPHVGNSTPTGVSPVNANLPPYIVINWIVRVS
jgi:microcystin-dependent protein